MSRTNLLPQVLLNASHYIQLRAQSDQTAAITRSWDDTIVAYKRLSGPWLYGAVYHDKLISLDDADVARAAAATLTQQDEDYRNMAMDLAAVRNNLQIICLLIRMNVGYNHYHLEAAVKFNNLELLGHVPQTVLACVPFYAAKLNNADFVDRYCDNASTLSLNVSPCLDITYGFVAGGHTECLEQLFDSYPLSDWALHVLYTGLLADKTNVLTWMLDLIDEWLNSSPKASLQHLIDDADVLHQVASRGGGCKSVLGFGRLSDDLDVGFVMAMQELRNCKQTRFQVQTRM
ncbi:hypothetical protein CAOG_05832 [Capsaspora owczarzaki ATCC 30864]|uniref:hypothetical protein n=1 Tax=Capsaspora owczarzaki (strain ATCC 30864) TaxID=595528 RepID=UPI0001FE33BB|nr:hypothetical protein CAOG_05832 [Capsaspora owczarzaki ATCC 30864]|eukprot:XP_004345422.1 hypothetical protein CAOG_05832 [Capsaspora owczarzaki ATCC 30864]